MSTRKVDARKCDALCVCGGVRFVHTSDLLHRVALRQPGDLRWFLWEPSTQTAVLDDDGRVKLVAQTRARRWTRVELIPG